MYQDVVEVGNPSYGCGSSDWKKVPKVALVRGHGRIFISLDHRGDDVLTVIA